MVDIAGSSSTAASIAIGRTVTSQLETVADHDWIRIDLVAGQHISIALNGLATGGAIALEDPLVTLRSASGAVITSDDDGGPGRNSLLHFTVATTGTYYIDVGAWDDAYTGGYQLSVTNYVAPVISLWSNDQIGNQLTHGFWGGDSHRFNVGPGGTLTVNLTALTTAGQNLARNALALWTDVIGVTFQEVTGTAQIRFDDNEEGAHADGVWSGGIISSAHVNVSSAWLSDYGTSLNSYSFQTYIHEIGHALGLGHAGEYNGEADYLTDRLFLNDSWAASIMSYFSPVENTDVSTDGFTDGWVMSPMGADIVAMASLYGLSTTTRTGNTTYGFNSNANRSIFDASSNGSGRLAYTIIDSGGTDTLDYSDYSANQRINLNAEAFSNVGGGVGNVSIARGTVIENAIGGSGNDVLIGNAVANRLTGGAGDDSLDGGGGADRLEAGPGNDTYYVDHAGDVVVELSGAGTDRIYASVTYTLAANVERLVLSGSANLWSMGNSGANTIVGNAGANRLYGYAGDDTLQGEGGSDRIDGGAGADTMYGGAGNDIFVVDNVLDLAVGGDGTDLVYASVSYTLRDDNERLYLTGTGALSGDGNGFNNIVVGNAGANILKGHAGGDRLYGEGGDDRLEGGSGNDRLDGGTGADAMFGGTGNDIYHVDHAGDTVGENDGEGTDVVYASVHHILAANVERLYLTGTADLTGKGNALGNILVGNSGANSIDGLDGDDRIYGGAGNDRIDGGNGNDRLDGDGGADTILGGAGADVLIGEDGNDWLQGGVGRDRMYGGSGEDRFVFADGDFGGVTNATADQIHDFKDAEGDRISLSLVDANVLVSGDQAFSWIGTAAFSGTAGELRTLQGSGNTFVQGDTNGDGVADFLIRLDGLHTLGTDDFIF